MDHAKSEALKQLCAAAKIARDAGANEQEIQEVIKRQTGKPQRRES